MVIARKIAYNVVFNVIAKGLSTFLALVGISFITRYLGKEGFGNYATVLAFFSFFGSFADLGLFLVAAREISRKGADESHIIGKIFSLRVSASIAVFLLSFFIVAFLPYPAEVKKGILVAALAFVFSSSYMVLNGIFQKNLVTDRISLVELIGKVIQVGIIILAVKNDLGFDFIILSLLAYMVFNFTFIFWMSRRYVKYKLNFDIKYWKEFLKESLPVGISVFITFLYLKTDIILLSLLKTSADVGIYSAAYKVIENILFFPAMIAGLILPIMSRYIFTEREKFVDISNKTFKVLFLIIVPIVVGVLFLAEDIISLIGGAGFAKSAWVLKVLIFSLLFMFFGNFFNNILIVGNQQKKLMKILFFCAVFNITSNLILIPAYSYKAAAIISAATEMLVTVLAAVVIYKNIHYRPRIHFGWKVLFSAAGMAAFLYFLRDGSFPVLVIGGAVVYFIFLWLTKAVTADEFSAIFSRKEEGVVPTQAE